MIVQRIRLSSYHRLSYVLLCVRIAIFESSNIHVLIVWIELCESGMDNEENRKDLLFRVKMDKRLWFKMEDPRVSLSLFDENVYSIVGLKRSRKIGAGLKIDKEKHTKDRWISIFLIKVEASRN